MVICGCSCASVSGGLLSNRGDGIGIIRGFTSVTGERYVDCRQRRKYIQDTDTRTVEARPQDKTGKTGHAELRYLDRHNSGRRLHVLHAYCTIGSFTLQQKVISFPIITACEDVDAHVAVRAKCRPRLAVKRWRLAPTHPLQAEASNPTCTVCAALGCAVTCQSVRCLPSLD
jgi:hypothetical protein